MGLSALTGLVPTIGLKYFLFLKFLSSELLPFSGAAQVADRAQSVPGRSRRSP